MVEILKGTNAIITKFQKEDFDVRSLRMRCYPQADTGLVRRELVMQFLGWNEKVMRERFPDFSAGIPPHLVRYAYLHGDEVATVSMTPTVDPDFVSCDTMDAHDDWGNPSSGLGFLH